MIVFPQTGQRESSSVVAHVLNRYHMIKVPGADRRRAALLKRVGAIGSRFSWVAIKRITWNGINREITLIRSAAPITSTSLSVEVHNGNLDGDSGIVEGFQVAVGRFCRYCPHSRYRSSVDPLRPILTKSRYGSIICNVASVM